MFNVSHKASKCQTSFKNEKVSEEKDFSPPITFKIDSNWATIKDFKCIKQCYFGKITLKVYSIITYYIQYGIYNKILYNKVR